jgi:hypothetical protein
MTKKKAMTNKKRGAIRGARSGPVDETVDEKARERRVGPEKAPKHG